MIILLGQQAGSTKINKKETKKISAQNIQLTDGTKMDLQKCNGKKLVQAKILAPPPDV